MQLPVFPDIPRWLSPAFGCSRVERTGLYVNLARGCVALSEDASGWSFYNPRIRIVQRKQVSYIEIASPSFSSRRIVSQEILSEVARILFYEFHQGFAINAYGALSREIYGIESQFLPNGCHSRAVHIRSGGNSGYGDQLSSRGKQSVTHIFHAAATSTGMPRYMDLASLLKF